MRSSWPTSPGAPRAQDVSRNPGPFPLLPLRLPSLLRAHPLVSPGHASSVKPFLPLSPGPSSPLSPAGTQDPFPHPSPPHPPHSLTPHPPSTQEGRVTGVYGYHSGNHETVSGSALFTFAPPPAGLASADICSVEEQISDLSPHRINREGKKKSFLWH